MPIPTDVTSPKISNEMPHNHQKNIEIPAEFSVITFDFDVFSCSQNKLHIILLLLLLLSIREQDSYRMLLVLNILNINKRHLLTTFIPETIVQMKMPIVMISTDKYFKNVYFLCKIKMPNAMFAIREP